MAKKKTTATPKNKGFSYYVELYGIILVLISIIGICKFGPVGDLIKGFAIFLAGSFSFVPLLLTFFVGGYMMVKRSYPKFFCERLIGLYLLILFCLIGAHFEYFKSDNLTFTKLMEVTISDIMKAINENKSILTSTVAGGGIVGAFFGYVFVAAFDIKGAPVVSIIMGCIGILLLFNLSLADIYKHLVAKIKAYFNNEARTERKVEKAEKAFDKNKKVVISTEDIEEVKPVKAEYKEPVRTATGYHLPPLSLLIDQMSKDTGVNNKEIASNSELLEKVFADFGIDGKVLEAHVGPTVTQYEMELKAGTKVSKVLSIQKELALALAAKDVLIQAPIPGKRTIGVELPNKKAAMVGLKEVLEATPSRYEDSKLLVGLGKNVMGNPMYAEINNTPHLLVAGATGSGKSICINTIISSILMRATPQEVKLVLIDPKKVELSMYNGIPHLLAPVVNDPKKASLVLRKIVSEMENRYDLFSDSKTKNIAGYNSYIESKNKTLPADEKINPLPYIVVIIDELADLMLVAAKEVEDSIMRITQMARAAGIHLIVATQRPSTDVITGVIKANIPSRISFTVSSSIDSRTILDGTGAEKLLGKGDMLFLPFGENTPMRIQGAYISERELKNIVDFTIAEQKATYDSSYTNIDEFSQTHSARGDDYDDPLYDEVVQFVIDTGKVSASLLQRRFRLGYNRAARIVDLLEDRGIIGPPNGSKPREVLMKKEENDED